MDTKSIGGYGEQLAIKYLEQRGYLILDRNYFCKGGELDIVAFKDDEFKFIEVKYRQKEGSISMLELLSDTKSKRVQNSALSWLQSKNKNIYSTRFAFDFISITGSEGNQKITLFENIFSL